MPSDRRLFPARDRRRSARHGQPARRRSRPRQPSGGATATAAWTSVYTSITDASERDPEIAALQSRLHEGFMAPFSAVVERAKSRGEMAPEKSAADLIAATVGPLFYRRWCSKEAIDERSVEAITDAAVEAAVCRKHRKQG